MRQQCQIDESGRKEDVLESVVVGCEREKVGWKGREGGEGK